MICSVESDYHREDLHKCQFCRFYIEEKYCQVRFKKITVYYHPICLELWKQKMGLN